MAAGVYAIVHRPSGRVYIGATRDMGRRWTRHRNRLRACAHANPSLQAAWDEDGERAFECVHLEVVNDLAQLQERERWHRGSKRSPETRARMADAARAAWARRKAQAA